MDGLMNGLSGPEIALGVTLLILLALVVVAGLVVAQRRRRLRARFGPEYDQTVRRTGSERRAAADLAAREKRVARFELHTLTVVQRESFVLAWRDIQSCFVDDPAGALAHADVLLGEVMTARGYPVTDFEHRAADLSVDHPEVVQNYRAGHLIALRHARAQANTENLRQAMIHYRALFDELVNEPGAAFIRSIPNRQETRL